MFYLVVVDPIKIQSRLAPQNVHQNLSFVKDINVVCEKMTRNCRKIVPKPICALHFRYVFNTVKPGNKEPKNCSLTPNVPYPYQINWQLVMGNGTNLFLIKLFLITKFDCSFFL